ncbi:DUF262 domain-containing protein [Chloroflexia bacterium SDU3-3]|nr:DUF262 domain-containing protein [Chloroflexia bacterium SDU3-3]
MITSQDREIQSLINDIRDGKLLLPEMQRGYVWKAPQVRNLFDSLYRNYPSGQLLVWETDDLPFSRQVSVEEVEHAQRRPQLLLDGQQRLTSLAAVMLGRPLIVRDTKRPIDIVFNVFTERFEVAGVRQRGETGWISVSKLFTSGPMRALREVRDGLSDDEEDKVLERLTRLDNIKSYKYRVNVLEGINYEEVTDIFVRINSGGTILNNADLALAQISARWRGVTDEFHKFQWGIYTKHSLWLDNGVMLRTMSLLLSNQSRLSQFFRGDQRRVAVEDIPDAWNRARSGLLTAIEFLIHNCKIDRLSLLPTSYILITLAAFFDRFQQQITTEQSRDLQRWVYLALAWSRYSNASETALDQDYAALNKPNPAKAMIESLEDKVGRGRSISERELRDQRKNSPFMVLSYVLAREAEAQDWFNSVKLGGSQPLELHHIFPKAVLAKKYNLRADTLIIDQVANLAFLSSKANNSISSRQPAEYLPKIEERRLRAQHVPMDPALWTLDQFEAFALQRRTMLADALNTLIDSLSDAPSLVRGSEKAQLESRIEALEHQLRDLVADRLTEARGEGALEHCIPQNTRRGIESRLRQRVGKNPFEADEFRTLGDLLQFCQFSDYARIMRDNWVLFSDTFGEGKSFDQHIAAVTTARNAFAHNNPIGKADLLSAEAGLIWMEDCLRALADREEPEAEDEDILAEAAEVA